MLRALYALCCVLCATRMDNFNPDLASNNFNPPFKGAVLRACLTTFRRGGNECKVNGKSLSECPNHLRAAVLARVQVLARFRGHTADMNSADELEQFWRGAEVSGLYLGGGGGGGGGGGSGGFEGGAAPLTLWDALMTEWYEPEAAGAAAEAAAAEAAWVAAGSAKKKKPAAKKRVLRPQYELVKPTSNKKKGGKK